MNKKPRPVLIIFSVLAALQVLAGASALADLLGDTAFGIFALSVAAIQVGMTFYIQNQVTPLRDVGAYVDPQGNMVAGPAVTPSTGSVTVVPAPRSGRPSATSPERR